MRDLFYLQHENIYILPILHYRMEMAIQTCCLFEKLQPDCVAVEFAETMQKELIHAASRLPDISVVTAIGRPDEALYYLCEPCEPAFEALRSALEAQVPCYCIDLNVESYPDFNESVPDPYSIEKIGLKNYYESYEQLNKQKYKSQLDLNREAYMARRLTELSLSYDRILFVCGMAHAHSIIQLLKKKKFPNLQHASHTSAQIGTLTDKSLRDVLNEFGWLSKHYEMARSQYKEQIRDLQDPDLCSFDIDRHQLILSLYKHAAEKYKNETHNIFQGYNFRNLMKFCRNYALVTNQLLPSLYQILNAAKGCVDHNYAFFVWDAATEYPYKRNIDNLEEKSLTIEDFWKNSKIVRFHFKQPSRKSFNFHNRKNRNRLKFYPPGVFGAGICSFQKEDVSVEKFGDFLKKKGRQVLLDDAARTIPFLTSIEDGIDIRETIRHWYEKKLYVKVRGRPPGMVGSVVVIFDEDQADEEKIGEKYPWKLTWMGEHQQESDMAFYATHMAQQIVGPGISRCEYGGFMMSYPPRRMLDIWSDPDYQACRTKAEVLLVSAIDYAILPVVVYVAAKPPRSALRSFAQRFGKKIVYVPIGQLSPILLNKIRVFHVLDGHDKRAIADEYIDG